MSFFSSITSTLSKGLDYLSAPLSQPLTFITKGPTAAAAAVATSRANIAKGTESGVAKIGTIVATTAVLGGAVLAAAPAASTGAAGAAARSVVSFITPSTPLKAVAAAASIPIVYGVVKSNPIAAQSVLESTPGKLTNFGTNVGTLISNPSLSNVATIFKENPVIAGATAAGIVGAVGLATAGIVSNISNTAAVKANTAATAAQQTGETIFKAPENQQPIQIINQIPNLPAVAAPSEVAPAGGVTPKKKAKKKKKTTKKKKKTTKKKKKTTRRSKKKKKKTIKRRKS